MEELIVIELSKGAAVWIAIVIVMLMVIAAIAGFYIGMGEVK